jgi:hypothetical protein
MTALPQVTSSEIMAYRLRKKIDTYSVRAVSA